MIKKDVTKHHAIELTKVARWKSSHNEQIYDELLNQFIELHRKRIIKYLDTKHSLNEFETSLVEHHLLLGRGKFMKLKKLHPNGTYTGRDKTKKFRQKFDSRGIKNFKFSMEMKTTSRSLTKENTVMIGNNFADKIITVSNILIDTGLRFNACVMNGTFEYPFYVDKSIIMWKSGADKSTKAHFLESFNMNIEPHQQSGNRSMIVTIMPFECKDNYTNLHKIYTKTDRGKMMRAIYGHQPVLFTIYLQNNDYLVVSSTCALAMEANYIDKFNLIRAKQFKENKRM